MKTLFIVIDSRFDCEGKYMSVADKKYFTNYPKALGYVVKELKECKFVEHTTKNKWNHYNGAFRIEKAKFTA